MELNVKEAFEGLVQRSDTAAFMDELKSEWIAEIARPFNPTRNNRQIALLLSISAGMRGLVGGATYDRVMEFDAILEEAKVTLSAKLARSPYGATLANAISSYCHPVRENVEPPQATRMWRRLDGQTTPF